MEKSRLKNLRRTYRHNTTWEVILTALAFFIAPNVHIYVQGNHKEAIDSSIYSTISFLAIRLIFFFFYWLSVNYRVRKRAISISRFK